MPDARINTALPGHHKTKRLIRRLGEGAGWSLIKLFLWAAQNKPDGDLTGMSTEEIELAIDWSGENDAFVNELVAIRFLDGTEGAYHIHDWAEHNPWVNGSDLRSLKARWNAVKRHHGVREADRQVPEYAQHRLTENDASSTKNDADSMKFDASSTGKDATSTKNDASSTHGTSTRSDASSTEIDASSNASSTEKPCSFPSPSPSPSPQEQEQELSPHAASPHTSNPGDPKPTEAGRACLLLRQAGCARVNPSNANLLAALAEGVTPEVLRDTFLEDPNKGSPFAWAIATARNRHAEGVSAVVPSSSRRGTASAAPSKTLQVLHELEDAKNGSGLDYPRDQQRIAEADPGQS